MGDRRFPRSVYKAGDEPDPRFSLANERTFLAWIRTSLALLAVGIALEAFALPIHPVLRFLASMVFILIAMIAAGYSWWSWMRNERALRHGRVLPGPSLGVIVVGGVLIASALIVVGLLL